jgi:hydroxymethylpyrimidine/phosphomethylpyrimidine kinase
MSARRVLTLAGHDPTGGAGVQADIEAIAAQGVAAFSVITALTVQDSTNVQRVEAVAPALLQQTLAVLLADCRVDAIKIGLIGDAAQVPVIAATLDQLAVPVVLDPVLRAGGGTPLANAELKAALLRELLPRVTLLTPNAAEARRLSGCAAVDGAGPALLAAGAGAVLVTGGDEPTAGVQDVLFRPGRPPQAFTAARIAGGFHGAGCTLASAIAARLALGEPLPQAIDTARRFTHEALQQARALGQGRRIPRRL